MIRWLIAAGLLTLSAHGNESTRDESEIRRLDQLWGEAIVKQDAGLVIPLYADDTIVLDPGAPAHRGIGEMRAIWMELVKTPGLGITIVPERITITGDIALDFGRFELKTTPPGAPAVTQVNKYLTVWRKISGHWRVIYDTWNTNAPP